MKGYLILPLKIEYKSDISAEDVGPGPAPSPCIMVWPTGELLIIEALNTPFIFAIYELISIRHG